MAVTGENFRHRFRETGDSRKSPGTPFSGGSPVGITTSLDFDGTTSEYLGNATLQDLGIGSAWSLNIWWKRTGAFSGNHYSVLINQASGANNTIRFELINTSANRLNALIYDDNGSDYSQIIDNDHFSTGSWIMTTYLFDTSLKIGKNGSETADTPGGFGNSMTNTNRRIYRIGYAFPGYIHSVSIWSVRLDTSNLAAIYNTGDGTNFNLHMDMGNYNQSANLAHWWVPGADTSSDNAMGTDYGFASNLINIMDNAANITTADLTADSPT